MGELYLAVLSCKLNPLAAGEQDREQAMRVGDVSCGVALGNTYLRMKIPSAPESSLRCWCVPHTYSVCSISVLLGNQKLGVVSVPVMPLRQHHADRTVDQWLPIVSRLNAAGDAGAAAAHLHILLHYRPRARPSGDAGENKVLAKSSVAPASFECRYRELLVDSTDEAEVSHQACKKILQVSRAGTVLHLVSLGGKTVCELEWDAQETLSNFKRRLSQRIGTTDDISFDVTFERGVLLSDEVLKNPDAELSTFFQESEDERQVEVPCSEGETLPAKEENCDNPWERTCSHLKLQCTSLSRETSELHEVAESLREEREEHREAHVANAKACQAAEAELLKLEAEIQWASEKLRFVQDEASAELLARKRLQQDLAESSRDFLAEVSEQRLQEQRLGIQRSEIRSVAETLGKRLSEGIAQGDELNLLEIHAGQEAAFMEAAVARFKHQVSEGGCVRQILEEVAGSVRRVSARSQRALRSDRIQVAKNPSGGVEAPLPGGHGIVNSEISSAGTNLLAQGES